MHRPALLLMVLLAACSGGETFDCDQVAIATTGGAPDDCDVQACQACADACGTDCAVLESYPPQYACEGESSWSVYDFCPDWKLPTGSTQNR